MEYKRNGLMTYDIGKGKGIQIEKLYLAMAKSKLDLLKK
jgi:hypothetical protein